MSPGKKKKKHDGPRDVRHRIIVFSAGSSPLKSTASTAARHVNRNVSSSVLSSVTHSSSSAPAPEIFESDEETPRVNDSAFSLDPQRVLSAYSRGSELHDKELEQVVITSAIAHRLKKNASAGDLCFSVEELLGWMEDLVTNRLAIVALAMQADVLLPPGGGTFAARMSEAIPEKLSKRNKTKNSLSDRLAEVYSLYTALARIVKKTPLPRSHVGKALSNLVTNIARVHVLCAKELQEDQEKKSYMQSVKLSGKHHSCLRLSVVIFPFVYSHMLLLFMADADMSTPYNPRGCFQSKGKNLFITCAKCGHGKVDWIRKDEIESHNKKDHARYKAEVVKYNQQVLTKTKGAKSLKKPSLAQKPLLIRCNCKDSFFSWYRNSCPNNCKNGSCDMCTCSCMFVCSTTNHPLVSIAVLEKKRSLTSSDDRVDCMNSARQYLQGGADVR